MKAALPSARISLTEVLTVILGIGLGVGAVTSVWWLISHAPESVKLYWVTGHGQLVVEQRSLWVSNQEQTLRASVEALLSGSPQSDLMSAIPPGVLLLGMRIEGGDIFLDLSPNFRQEEEIVSSDVLLSRVQQVVYTATQDYPEGRVWLSLRGQALEQLGSLRIPQPLTRASVSSLPIASPE